jgi:hypothetical protein
MFCSESHLNCGRFPSSIYSNKLLGLSPLANYTDRAIAASQQISANVCDRGCHVVSVTDPYSRILRFLDQSPYFFFQVASQLYSRG